MGIVSFEGDENVLKFTMVIVTQVCDYTKTLGIGHFKWVNCIVSYNSTKLLLKRKMFNLILAT